MKFIPRPALSSNLTRSSLRARRCDSLRAALSSWRRSFSVPTDRPGNPNHYGLHGPRSFQSHDPVFLGSQATHLPRPCKPCGQVCRVQGSTQQLWGSAQTETRDDPIQTPAGITQKGASGSICLLLRPILGCWALCLFSAWREGLLVLENGPALQHVTTRALGT